MIQLIDTDLHKKHTCKSIQMTDTFIHSIWQYDRTTRARTVTQQLDRAQAV